MSGILLTQSSTFIISQVAWALGKLMDGIFVLLDNVFGIQSIGISIILFTIVIYSLMLPLTIKQQKFSKLSAVMNPEIQKIQKKYKGKKDQASMMKQQDETKLVYEKYGTSPTGGCLQLFIQMPILFGLYEVIRNIPAYVSSIKNTYTPLVDGILSSEQNIKVLESIGSESPILMDTAKYDYTNANTIVDVLYKFQTETWDVLSSAIPSLESIINSVQTSVEGFNSFVGINIANSPSSIITENITTNTGIAIVALMIPLLSGASQFINLRLAQANQNIDPENPMASSLGTMNKVMPIMSMFFCLTLPAGLGIYWIVSAVVRTIQQVLINKYLSNVSVEDMIAKNQEAASRKREKQGENAKKINELAQKKATNFEEAKSNINEADREKLLNNAKNNVKPGSLAAKANMVKDFNKDK